MAADAGVTPGRFSFVSGPARLHSALAVAMRLALVFLVVVIFAALAVFTYRWVRQEPPILSIVPTGRPTTRRGPQGQIDVAMVVGVTNNSRSSLMVGVGVASGKSGDSFRSSSRGIEELKPGCGILWPVTYNTSWPKPQLLGADYLRIQSSGERRARAILFKLGVPGVGTNDLWRSVVVGQVSYE